jgi:DNA-binding response OmpR family regulator
MTVSTILLCQPPGSALTDLEASLAKKGHEVTVVGDLAALEEIEDPAKFQHADLDAVDLLILDVSSGLDGSDSCRTFTRTCPRIPVILIVAEEAPVSVECRHLTCGNVLRLPFTPRKVTRRIESLLSRRQGKAIQVGNLTLVPEMRCVYRGDTYQRLTPRQAKLLEVFMRNAGQTLTRKYLMEAVWDTDYMGDTRTLDVHVRWIRERIEEEPSSPRYLRTVRGIGYRFAAPPEEEAASE